MKYDSVVNSFTFAAYSALLDVAGLGFASGFADEAGCAVFRLSDFCAWTRVENCQPAIATRKADRKMTIGRRVLVFTAHSLNGKICRRAKHTATAGKGKGHRAKRLRARAVNVVSALH